MARRRKKKTVRIIPLSAGPLPAKLAVRFADRPLVFCDASRLQHGGLAAVLFADEHGEPATASRRVALAGSNELELQAALFALSEARRHFPDRPFALFSDNRDAVDRLNRAKTAGLAQDPALAALLATADLAPLLAAVDICWVPGHASCRGNALADEGARMAAGISLTGHSGIRRTDG